MALIFSSSLHYDCGFDPCYAMCNAAHLVVVVLGANPATCNNVPAIDNLPVRSPIGVRNYVVKAQENQYTLHNPTIRTIIGKGKPQPDLVPN
jgi:hypothetical protein